MRVLVSAFLGFLACASSTTGPTEIPPANPPKGMRVDLSSSCDSPADFVRAALPTMSPDAARSLATWRPPSAPSYAMRPHAEAIVRSYVAHCGMAETIALASDLVRFPTVSASESAADGPAFVAMAAYLERWSKDAGLDFRAVGKNDVWEIGLGAGDATVGFVMHGDVVPAADVDDGKAASDSIPPGWTHAPFDPVVRDGRLYGRGSEDDKAPISSVLVAMRALARFGLAPKGRILAIVGTGEEHDWDPMIAYAKSGKHPRSVISLDSSYPVVAAESGFVAWRLSTPKKAARRRGGCVEAKHARGGNFLTQVPGDASLTVGVPRGTSESSFVDRLREVARAEREVRGESYAYSIEKNGSGIDVKVTGRAVHSSTAEDGANALWALSGFAAKLGLCDGGISRMLTLLHAEFDGDHFGERLGLAYEHEFMGKLLVAPTVLRTEGDTIELAVNMRRPANQTSDEFGKHLDEALARVKKSFDPKLAQSEKRYIGEPAIADTRGALVPTLLDIYREATGESDAKPVSIRGGTYARLFPGAVSFGPSRPGRPYRGHAPDEYIDLDTIDLMNRTVLEAIIRLD